MRALPTLRLRSGIALDSSRAANAPDIADAYPLPSFAVLEVGAWNLRATQLHVASVHGSGADRFVRWIHFASVTTRAGVDASAVDFDARTGTARFARAGVALYTLTAAGFDAPLVLWAHDEATTPTLRVEPAMLAFTVPTGRVLPEDCTRSVQAFLRYPGQPERGARGVEPLLMRIGWGASVEPFDSDLATNRSGLHYCVPTGPSHPLPSTGALTVGGFGAQAEVSYSVTAM